MAKVKWVASSAPEIPNRGKFVIIEPGGQEGGEVQYAEGKGLTYDPKSLTSVDRQIQALIPIAQGYASELDIETIYVIKD